MPAAEMIGLEDVIVLGAGPAGLALGFELKQRKIPFVILERGRTVASSWSEMPACMKLLSPWKANRLPGGHSQSFRPNAEVSRADYCSWLQNYAASHALPIIASTEVKEVCRTEEGAFATRTSGGDFTSRLLVNATGYFSMPYTPEIPGARESIIPQFHYANYRDADTLRNRVGKKEPLILVVGKRLSAGQTMVELIEGGCSVALSHRGTMSFGSGPVGWWIFFRIHPWLEALKLRWQGSRARGVEIRMQGGKARRLLESGMVRRFPEIAAFEKPGVIFRNGERLEPDAVIYATGFRPALRHLSALDLALDAETGLPAVREMESQTVPGLFFLGLDGLRNFQSRFIRGIRNDAAVLAERLDERLRQVRTSEKSEQGSLAHVT